MNMIGVNSIYSKKSNNNSDLMKLGQSGFLDILRKAIRWKCNKWLLSITLLNNCCYKVLKSHNSLLILENGTNGLSVTSTAVRHWILKTQLRDTFRIDLWLTVQSISINTKSMVTQITMLIMTIFADTLSRLLMSMTGTLIFKKLSSSLDHKKLGESGLLATLMSLSKKKFKVSSMNISPDR